jgi:hypothetical protein
MSLANNACPSDAPPEMVPDRPHLIFTTRLDGAALAELLATPGLLATLAANGDGVALGMARPGPAHAAAACALADGGVMAVAWLRPHPEDGPAFNAQNYPQARAAYLGFRDWAREHGLRFDAVGLEIAPPVEVARADLFSPRYLARRLWLAGDNVLWPAARAAYADLLAVMRHDGYETHSYQWPLAADDRRAGTTLVQRALEIVDLPSDLDVLICRCADPQTCGRLGSAFVASYATSADALLLDAARGWPALQRDLLLAARHCDTLYLDSLEACVAGGLLPRLAALDWSAPARAPRLPRLAVGTLRALLLLTLLGARFGPRALAWAGWVLAALLWLRGRRDTAAR